MFVTEIWQNKKLQTRFAGLPSCLEFDPNIDLRNWYLELSKSKKWHNFCEFFDEKFHRSGCMTFENRTICVYKKEH